jgi:hypothetical protein
LTSLADEVDLLYSEAKLCLRSNFGLLISALLLTSPVSEVSFHNREVKSSPSLESCFLVFYFLAKLDFSLCEKCLRLPYFLQQNIVIKFHNLFYSRVWGCVFVAKLNPQHRPNLDSKPPHLRPSLNVVVGPSPIPASNQSVRKEPEPMTRE